MRALPLLGLASLTLAAQPRVAGEPSVAVVASVAGKVTLTYPDGQKAGAQSLDWLKTRTSIETDAASRLVLVLMNGARYEVRERSRATLEKDSVRTVAGTVRRLPGLAEIPKLAAIAAPLTTARGGVVRVRGPKLQHCYPSANATILSGSSTFSFDPVAGLATYTVEIEDEQGTVVYRGQSSGAPVRIPAGVLKPGASYYWELRGVPPEQEEGPQCGGDFSVLPVEDETRRAALRTALRNQFDGPDALALLGEIDRRLGLLREAREEFTAALKGSSTPGAIGSILVEIEQCMR